MQPTVTTFDLRAWSLREDIRFPRRNSCPLNEFERLAMKDRESKYYDAFEDEFWHGVTELCKDVGSKMPHITHLRFILTDGKLSLMVPEDVTAMILALQKLKVLDLATYGTQMSFLETISSHDALHTINTAHQSWPLRAADCYGDWRDDFVEIMFDGDPDPETTYGIHSNTNSIPTFCEEAFRNLTSLQLTTSVFELNDALRKWPARALGTLQRLAIDTSFFTIRSMEDLQELIQLIVARFPILTALSLALPNSMRGDRDGESAISDDIWLTEWIQVDATLLQPLTALDRLTSLEVRGNRSSRIPAQDWPALLKAWPHLEVLVLDNKPIPESVVGRGFQPGDAPLDKVLETFHDLCPALRVLSVHVDGTLTPGTSARPPRVPRVLHALELVLPRLLPWDDEGLTPEEEECRRELNARRTERLATYLHAALPSGCGLHVMDHGDFGLCDTLPRAPSGPWSEDECWHDILNEWAVLHEAEGKKCRAQRCAETRGDVVVPVYEALVGDSED